MITKQKTFNNISLLLIWSIILLLAICNGISRLYTINFNPINGDFQNYNVVRRFINGQAPFSDFTVYLGLGHLILLSLPQMFFGDNFAASLLISNAITFACFALFCFAISNLILRKPVFSAVLTLFFCFFNLLRPDFLMKIMDSHYISGFNIGLSPGNSARLIRMTIIPLMLLFLPRIFEKKQNDFSILNIRNEVIIAAIVGISITWSNDGGISWFIIFSIYYCILHIKSKGLCLKLIYSTVIYIITSSLSLFMFLTIITHWKPFSYFKQIIGINSYQRWYFGGLKPSSLLDLEMNFYIAINLFLIVFFTLKFIKTKINSKTNMTFFFLSCAMSAGYISSITYYYYNGGSLNETLYLCAFIIFISYICKFTFRFDNLNRLKSILIVIFPLLTFILLMIVMRNYMPNLIKHGESAVYVSELKGYLSNPSPELLSYTKERIENKKIFSTYASAIETMTEQFQPSGTDYIIHVLGDEQRKEYLEAFKKADFEYVSTINPDHDAWGYWIIQANWFFHRELLKYYKPVFTNGYQIYWKKQNELANSINNNCKIDIFNISESSAAIVVTTDDISYNGMADVKINYSLNFKKFFSRAQFNKSLIYYDKLSYPGGALNYSALKPSSNVITENIPVTLVNGLGAAVFESSPANNIELKIFNAEVEGLFVFPFNFAYSINPNDKKWQNVIGILQNNQLVVKKSNAFNIALRTAYEFKVHEFEGGGGGVHVIY